MKLYFQHSNGELDFVKQLDSLENAITEALNDLAVRAPHFKSYYQRTWKDDDGIYWIDVGDHCCFYNITEA